MLTPSEAALTFSDTAHDIECLIDTDDGREIPVLASAAPIHNDDGTIWAVVSRIPGHHGTEGSEQAQGRVRFRCFA